MAVNEVNMRKWLAALRSGEYVQATSNLMTTEYGDKRYCCLGVASELFRVDGHEHTCRWNRVGDSNGAYVFTDGFKAEQSYLTPDVADWLGLEDRDPIIFEITGRHQGQSEVKPGKSNGMDIGYYNMNTNTTQFTLTCLNDDKVPFPVIADLIEMRYLPQDRM